MVAIARGHDGLAEDLLAESRVMINSVDQVRRGLPPAP